MKSGVNCFKLFLVTIAALAASAFSSEPLPNREMKKIEPAQAVQTQQKSSSSLDKDLSGYPEYYKRRIMAFRSIIRNSRTKEAKILTAVKILEDENSPYKREAIEFLADIKAKEGIPAITKAGEKKDLRPDAAYAIGEIRDERGIEFLLRCLYDASDNVRGNAIASLKKITKRDFGYAYSDNEDLRNRAARLWENWWNENKKTFQIPENSEEDQKDAVEKWEKYGKPYIERLKKE